MLKKLGIYIHIPFCVQKCNYCDFLSAPSDPKIRKEYVNALIKEIDSYRELEKEYAVRTIYVGGGTPSLLEGSEMERILLALREVFQIGIERDEPIEVTIEANPGTLTKEKLAYYKKLKINRLSIGLQSTSSKELALLGRIHTYEEFQDNYLLAVAMGFDNINIDIMSGLPGQTVHDFEETLQKVIDLHPQHISSYSLIVEEGTPFYDIYGEEEPNDIEIDRAIYERTKMILEENGYYRYEISNYAKKGFEGMHNSAYWQGIEYLGIGLGASSMIGNIRYHNEEDLKIYNQLSASNIEIQRELHVVTKKEQMEEFMFLGLRMMQGIHTSQFRKLFGIDIEVVYGEVLQKWIDKGYLVRDKERIYLSERGIDVSNQVMAEFLL